MKTIICVIILAAISGASPSPSFLRQEDKRCTDAGQQAEVDRLLFHVDMADFTKARDAQNLSCLNWSSDGCSYVPDKVRGVYDFKPSCRRHDFGYRNYKKQNRCSQKFKDSIDQNFKKDMKNYCHNKYKHWYQKGEKKLCQEAADKYYDGVRDFGKVAWCK